MVHSVSLILSASCRCRSRYPDPTLRFDADADPDPSNGFTHVGKSEIILLLFTAVTVYLSHQRQRGHHFQYFEQYFEIFYIKYNLALHLVEMDTYPDPLKLFRSDRIRIHHYIVHKPIN
jgi:hypothetical protein